MIRKIFDKEQESLTWEASEDSAPEFTGGTLCETGALFNAYGIRKGKRFGGSTCVHYQVAWNFSRNRYVIGTTEK